MLTIRVDKGKTQPHSRGGLKQIGSTPMYCEPSQSGLTRVGCVDTVINGFTALKQLPNLRFIYT